MEIPPPKPGEISSMNEEPLHTKFSLDTEYTIYKTVMKDKLPGYVPRLSLQSCSYASKTYRFFIQVGNLYSSLPYRGFGSFSHLPFSGEK